MYIRGLNPTWKHFDFLLLHFGHNHPSTFWKRTSTVHTSAPVCTVVRSTVKFNAKLQLINHHHLLPPPRPPPTPSPLQLRTLSDINLPAACTHRYRSKVNKAACCPAVTGASNSFRPPFFLCCRAGPCDCSCILTCNSAPRLLKNTHTHTRAQAFVFCGYGGRGPGQTTAPTEATAAHVSVEQVRGQESPRGRLTLISVYLRIRCRLICNHTPPTTLSIKHKDFVFFIFIAIFILQADG